MNSFFYPSPGHRNFSLNTWEPWNKLKTRPSKKSFHSIILSKKPSNETSFTLSRLLQDPPPKPQNPLLIKKKAEYIKYSRHKSDLTLEDLTQQGESLFADSSPVKVVKKEVYSSREFNMQLHGTKISSKASKPRPLSIKSFYRPNTRQRSYTVVKKWDKKEVLETPTPW